MAVAVSRFTVTWPRSWENSRRVFHLSWRHLIGRSYVATPQDAPPKQQRLECAVRIEGDDDREAVAAFVDACRMHGFAATTPTEEPTP